MKPGTPQFVGLRLREAREARGITALELARHAGVSPATVSQYERGAQSPSPEVLRRMAVELAVPVHFFLRPIKESHPSFLFFRSLSSATKRDRIRAARRYQWLGDVVEYVRTLVEFPVVRFPELNHGDDPRAIRNDSIEEAATTVRRYWGLGDGPISNLVWLVENNGGIVARQKLDSDALDAFSQWNDRDHTPYVVIGTEKASAVRARFNVAHEVAHLVLHRHVPISLFQTAEIFKLMEEQANRFAGALLMPATTFAASVRSISLDGFRAIKELWRVAIAAMIMRCSQLGLINDAQLQRLFINRSRRGWTVTEPLDDTLQFEPPRFLRRAFDLLKDQGLASREHLELQIARKASDIEAVVGLSEGYLTPSQMSVRLRSHVHHGIIAEPDDSANAWVLPFPKAKGDSA